MFSVAVVAQYKGDSLVQLVAVTLGLSALWVCPGGRKHSRSEPLRCVVLGMMMEVLFSLYLTAHVARSRCAGGI